MPTFFEFFAGGGMVRAGLGKGWECLFANDFDAKKCRSYESNWRADDLLCEDIKSLSTNHLPGQADLAWGSFPCQDLSLAGSGAGLKGDRSGTFWPFWKLMTRLKDEGRPPPIIALENVCGMLTSHKGKDFQAISEAFASIGYNFGALVVDASLFVPQSRPRLFLIGINSDLEVPLELRADEPVGKYHPRALVRAHGQLSDELKSKWIWWNLPTPRKRKKALIDVVEADPTDVKWHSEEETSKLLSMMSEVNLAKVRDAQAAGEKRVGAIYKRTRRDEFGRRVQRAEVRFDDLSGCLRTPAGGSSRQLLLFTDGDQIRSRLVSARETARLMGLPDSYRLPDSYNEAYHLTGDGVAVPVVRHLAKNIFEPMLAFNERTRKLAA